MPIERSWTNRSCEHETLRSLIRDEMQAGALGIGAALIYPPAFFADTNELIELCRAAAPYGGRYIAHMRNESLGLLEGIDELVRIAREAGVPAESYHLKAGGQVAWPLMAKAVERIEAARAEGLAVTADMYTYTAGATGLDAAMPPWVQEGGHAAWVERLQDPDVRARVLQEIRPPGDGWENLYHALDCLNCSIPGTQYVNQADKLKSRRENNLKSLQATS